MSWSTHRFFPVAKSVTACSCLWRLLFSHWLSKSRYLSAGQLASMAGWRRWPPSSPPAAWPPGRLVAAWPPNGLPKGPPACRRQSRPTGPSPDLTARLPILWAHPHPPSWTCALPRTRGGPEAGTGACQPCWPSRRSSAAASPTPARAARGLRGRSGTEKLHPSKHQDRTLSCIQSHTMKTATKQMPRNRFIAFQVMASVVLPFLRGGGGCTLHGTRRSKERQAAEKSLFGGMLPPRLRLKSAPHLPGCLPSAWRPHPRLPNPAPALRPALRPWALSLSRVAPGGAAPPAASASPAARSSRPPVPAPRGAHPADQ